MARQIVSYDDLDVHSSVSVHQSANNASSSSITHTATVGEEAATSAQQHTSNTNGAALSASSPPKKRKRDEALAGDKVLGNPEENADPRLAMNTSAGVSTGPAPDLPSFQPTAPKPPVKKRGKHKRRSGAGACTGYANGSVNLPLDPRENGAMHHWDDPGAEAHGISYDDEAEELKEEEMWEDADAGANATNFEDGDDESRELTQEEIWDDSALIAAWDAANEEYEAMHGKNKKGWKKERVHNSPLWYNVPPEKPIAKNKGKSIAKQTLESASAAQVTRLQMPTEILQGGETQSSSTPLDFDTYVPSHDPSLVFSSIPPSTSLATQEHFGDINTQYASMLPDPHRAPLAPGSSAATSAAGICTISADDAFSRAVGAMYWCGYWTAVYHMQNSRQLRMTATNIGDNEEEVQEQDEEEAELLVSTQR